MEETTPFSALTKSLQMAAAELNKAHLASQQALLHAPVTGAHHDVPGSKPDERQQEPQPAPVQHALRPRAASAARVRPSSLAGPEAAWPRRSGAHSHFAGMQSHPAGPGTARMPQPPQQPQAPVSLHSSVLKALPREAAAKSSAGSVAGSAAPSLAATLGRIHRQLAEASVPLRGSDARDPKAWMMHNPKHSILQTQAKLNRLARLEKPHPRPPDPQLAAPPPHHPQQQPQPARAQSPAGSLGSAWQAGSPQLQTAQPHLHLGMCGGRGGDPQGARTVGGREGGAVGAGALTARGLAQGPSAGVGQGVQGPLLHRPTSARRGLPGGFLGAGAAAARQLPGGPASQQGPGQQAWVPPTESALRQLPVMPKPWGYRPVPSEAGSHADWWKRDNRATASALGSVRSYPRTAVTDRDSVTPSELAAWEARMNNLEATIQDEKNRRKKFEEELRQLEALALSRGAITTGGIAVAKGPTAGKQQQQLHGKAAKGFG